VIGESNLQSRGNVHKRFEKQKAPPETKKIGVMISQVLTAFNYSSYVGEIKSFRPPT